MTPAFWFEDRDDFFDRKTRVFFGGDLADLLDEVAAVEGDGADVLDPETESLAIFCELALDLNRDGGHHFEPLGELRRLEHFDVLVHAILRDGSEERTNLAVKTQPCRRQPLFVGFSQAEGDHGPLFRPDAEREISVLEGREVILVHLLDEVFVHFQRATTPEQERGDNATTHDDLLFSSNFTIA